MRSDGTGSLFMLKVLITGITCSLVFLLFTAVRGLLVCWPCFNNLHVLPVYFSKRTACWAAADLFCQVFSTSMLFLLALLVLKSFLSALLYSQTIL